MAAQYDIYRTTEGDHVLVLQHDLFDTTNTRVVARLVPANWGNTPMRGVMPIIHFGDMTLKLNPLQVTTMRVRDLGQHIGSAAHLRDDITRALDMLFTGH